MLEAQIAQQATSSSTPLRRLPSEPESNPREQCNYVTLKEGVKDREDITLEEGREVITAESKEKNDEAEPAKIGDFWVLEDFIIVDMT